VGTVSIPLGSLLHGDPVDVWHRLADGGGKRGTRRRNGTLVASSTAALAAAADGGGGAAEIRVAIEYFEPSAAPQAVPLAAWAAAVSPATTLNDDLATPGADGAVGGGEEPDGSAIADDAVRRVVMEIYTSERVYLRRLGALVSLFETPLRGKQRFPLLTPEECDAVFGNAAEVRSIGLGVLTRLRACLLPPLAANPVRSVARAFLAEFDGPAFVRTYSRYINLYTRSMATLARCRIRPRLREFLDNVQARPECESQDLSSLLIMPVQRIPRYELLLHDLIRKVSAAAPPGLAHLRAAHARLRELARDVNARKRRHENLTTIYNIQTRMPGIQPEALLQPGRRYVREGFLTIGTANRHNPTDPQAAAAQSPSSPSSPSAATAATATAATAAKPRANKKSASRSGDQSITQSGPSSGPAVLDAAPAHGSGGGINSAEETRRFVVCMSDVLLLCRVSPITGSLEIRGTVPLENAQVEPVVPGAASTAAPAPAAASANTTSSANATSANAGAAGEQPVSGTAYLSVTSRSPVTREASTVVLGAEDTALRDSWVRDLRAAVERLTSDLAIVDVTHRKWGETRVELMHRPPSERSALFDDDDEDDDDVDDNVDNNNDNGEDDRNNNSEGNGAAGGGTNYAGRDADAFLELAQRREELRQRARIAVATGDTPHATVAAGESSLLAFRRGEVVAVLRDNVDGWAYGECGGRFGFFAPDLVPSP
jgi:hypothetical protein